MGTLRQLTMKSVAVIFLAGLALVAVTTAVEEGTSREESSFAEATQFVQNFLAQGENDETACEKVANTAIAAIVDECATLQKDIDERAKNNKHCCNSGLDNIDTAKKAHEASKTAHSTCLEELAKAVDDSIYAACLARGKCETDAEDAKDKTFDDANKACGSQKNKDAFTRAHHMKCVLAGKTLQGCTVPTPPKVTKTAMNVNKCELKCELMNNYEHSTCKGDGIKGLRIDKTCGHNVMGLLINKDKEWDKQKTYHCPKGWYWPTANQWFNKLSNYGCSQNNAKSQKEGTP